MNDMYLDLFYGPSEKELEDNYKKDTKYYDAEQPAGRKINEEDK